MDETLGEINQWRLKYKDNTVRTFWLTPNSFFINKEDFLVIPYMRVRTGTLGYMGYWKYSRTALDLADDQCNLDGEGFTLQIWQGAEGTLANRFHTHTESEDRNFMFFGGVRKESTSVTHLTIFNVKAEDDTLQWSAFLQIGDDTDVYYSQKMCHVSNHLFVFGGSTSGTDGLVFRIEADAGIQPTTHDTIEFAVGEPVIAREIKCIDQ